MEREQKRLENDQKKREETASESASDSNSNHVNEHDRSETSQKVASSNIN